MTEETKNPAKPPVLAGIDYAVPGSDKTVLAEMTVTETHIPPFQGLPHTQDPERVIRKFAMVDGKKEIPGEGMVKEG